MSRAGLGPLVQGMAGAQSWESYMRFSESGLKKECCLSPTRGTRFGTKGRATSQASGGVRQNKYRCRERLSGSGEDETVEHPLAPSELQVTQTQR